MTLQVTKEGTVLVSGEGVTKKFQEAIIRLSTNSGISVNEACE